jgi:hypothetical protein
MGETMRSVGIELMCCPFCGEDPKVRYIGNSRTKSISVEIRCPECRIKRTDSAHRHSWEWLEGVAARNWNQRPNPGGSASALSPPQGGE